MPNFRERQKENEREREREQERSQDIPAHIEIAKPFRGTGGNQHKYGNLLNDSRSVFVSGRRTVVGSKNLNSVIAYNLSA